MVGSRGTLSDPIGVCVDGHWQLGRMRYHLQVTDEYFTRVSMLNAVES